MSECMHVAFATGSRADYGIVRKYLSLLASSDKVELSILVTGALLDENYGKQVRLIEEDGFNIATRIPLPLDTKNNSGIAHSIAIALDGFADYFEVNKYDLLIILGDRYEMLSVAIAAAMQRVPIMHLHGGEATYANYDEFIRHAITKMSMYHIVSTDEYRRRVIQLGEHPSRVFNLGSLGAENCLNIDEQLVQRDIRDLTDGSYLVVLFHPETISGIDVRKQLDEILRSLEFFSDHEIVFIGSNADTNSDTIRGLVSDWVSTHDNARYYESLPTNSYHYLLKHSLCLLGNSSSGIIEAPSLGIRTINIGNRQDGRVRGSSVVDVNCETAQICSALREVVNHPLCVSNDNPYYQSNCARRYLEITLKILDSIRTESTSIKRFYDLQLDSDILHD